jgi:hypothetical protein
MPALGSYLLRHRRGHRLFRWICRYSQYHIDSNYMNDLWSYNSATLKWEEIQTTGDKPTHRSNCSMNYDPLNNQIVIFGGGGPNKQRFNSINILDWSTKKWI